jgi:hypothetical protein
MNNFNCTPTPSEVEEASRLFKEGYLPVSNRYLLAGLAPADEDTAEVLGKLYKGMPGAEHWRRFSKADQRDHLARMRRESKELKLGVYVALKKLCKTNP